MRGADPVISEFMAANTASLADDNGEYSDWLEIYNPGPAAVNLDGWYLTDSAANKTKWKLPAISLAAGGYLVVFASNKNRRDPAATLHTNFALSASGEYLGLVRPDGVTVAHEYAPAFPAQTNDVSYGIVERPAGGFSSPAWLTVSTPGAANGAAGVEHIAETVSFSQPPGPFRTGFQLELTGANSGQQIRYVIGTGAAVAALPEPTRTSTLYTGPIQIDASTYIRAAIFSGEGQGKGAVASAYYAKVGTSAAGFSSRLPVLVVDTLATGPLVQDGIDHPSWSYLYSPQAGSPTFARAPELIRPECEVRRRAVSHARSGTARSAGVHKMGARRPVVVRSVLHQQQLRLRALQSDWPLGATDARRRGVSQYRR
jgi:hypothetical protein